MRRPERAMAAGAEALALGTLVLLAGTIMVTNAWAVIDTNMALEAAAREYLRAYTEADEPTAAAANGDTAARAVLQDRPGVLGRLRVVPPSPETFGPCAPAAVTVSARVPAIRIPAIDAQWGEHTVSISAVELIDAHQEMVSGPAYDRAGTACGD